MNRPHVTLKLATSLDGRIATASGESRWITGEAARAEVQRMRAASDAVMIGAGTARADNPSLISRTDPAPAKQPLRVVISRALDLPPEGELFRRLEEAPLLIFASENASSERRQALERLGARIETAPPAHGGRLSMRTVLERLKALGVARILVEGGGQLAAALLEEGFVDRIEWFRAPIVLGEEGLPAVAALALSKLADAPAFRRVALRELGPDLWESYERAS